jgi:hypothetical protein
MATGPTGGTAAWRFERAVRRVQPLEGILADYATQVCGLPVRRREAHGAQAGVTWSIDGEPMVELVVEPDGPDRLLVHELSLLAPVRRTLRTRHLRIEYAPGR